MSKVPPVLGVSHIAFAVQAPAFAAQLARVEVDPDTGEVTLHEFVVVQDAGKAINPLGVEGQMQGGAVQSLGFALTEALLFDEKGRLTNPSLLDYRKLTAADLPNIETIIVEVPSPAGPFGARGVGEPPIVPAPAAIANAVSRRHRRAHHRPARSRRSGSPWRWSRVRGTGTGNFGARFVGSAFFALHRAAPSDVHSRSGPHPTTRIAGTRPGRPRGVFRYIVLFEYNLPDMATAHVTGELQAFKARFFKALAHPIRIRLVELLVERDRAVQELQAALTLDQSSVSQHLAVLRANHVVSARKEGVTVRYALRDPIVGRPPRGRTADLQQPAGRLPGHAARSPARAPPTLTCRSSARS